MDSPRGGTPMEYQINKWCFTQYSRAAMIFMAASLPSLQFRFAVKTCVFKTRHRRSSSHHKARHSPGVTPDAQPHRPIHQLANDHLLVRVNENQCLLTSKKNTTA